MRQHGGFHARAANFIDGGTAHPLGQSCAKRRLARGRLSQSCRKNAAHIDFFRHIDRNIRAFNRRLDGNGSQRRCRQRLELALQAAMRIRHGVPEDHPSHAGIAPTHPHGDGGAQPRPDQHYLLDARARDQLADGAPQVTHARAERQVLELAVALAGTAKVEA